VDKIVSQKQTMFYIQNAQRHCTMTYRNKRPVLKMHRHCAIAQMQKHHAQML